ncbi:hypothetical protein GCM10011579_068920 [Streptomyces albiflavescens]|uniref:Uncharacterized protein n=1 Tax=Streptomyces albiflavescens TaxID=1623582 RepID=A0A917YAV6_9ACTN|nr:hypothetical protein GCM10011579_068920 [Streptomyces albiflavescens]
MIPTSGMTIPTTHQAQRGWCGCGGPGGGPVNELLSADIYSPVAVLAMCAITIATPAAPYTNPHMPQGLRSPTRRVPVGR